MKVKIIKSGDKLLHMAFHIPGLKEIGLLSFESKPVSKTFLIKSPK